MNKFRVATVIAVMNSLRRYTERGIEVLTKVGVRSYIKKNLQPFLPEGYENPLRVAQHH